MTENSDLIKLCTFDARLPCMSLTYICAVARSTNEVESELQLFAKEKTPHKSYGKVISVVEMVEDRICCSS